MGATKVFFTKKYSNTLCISQCHQFSQPDVKTKENDISNEAQKRKLMKTGITPYIDIYMIIN